MRLRKKILVLSAIIIIALVALTACSPGCGSKSSEKVQGTATPPAQMTASVVGKVVDTTNSPIPGALVRVSGPFRSTEAASNYEQLTNEEGVYWIGVPIDGEYDLFASVEGYEASLLVSGQHVEEVKGLFGAPDIILKRKAEFTPARGTDAYIYGKGVQKDDVCRVEMDYGLIASCDEIKDPVAVTKSGAGWTTYVRDGQAISTKPANYENEPFWEVTFKSDRPDGLKVLYVQRKCGNVSAPPGEKIPPPRKEVIGPTPTPVVGSSPTPPATGVPPTATCPPPPPTPTSPLPTQTAEPTPTRVAPCLDCPPPPTEEPLPPEWSETATPVNINNPPPTVKPPSGSTPTPRPSPILPTPLP
jgi:hypothetical protein